MEIGFKFPNGMAVDLAIEQNGETAAGRVDSWADAHAVVHPESGRVNVLDADLGTADTLAKVEQPDGTYALDLRGSTQVPVEYYTTTDNKIIKVDPLPAFQERGWGPGEHYFLEIDANGDTIIEPGETHRKVYVTANTTTQWTPTKIASSEGIDASAVTTSWLMGQSKYGAIGYPLEPVLGKSLFDALINRDTMGSSHWLMIERGHDYSVDFSVARPSNAKGESALHPIVFGAWGDGDRPVINHRPKATNRPARFIVWRDLSLNGGYGNNTDANMFRESLYMSRSSGSDMQMGYGDVTLRFCNFLDISKDTPLNGVTWEERDDRESGIYYNKTNHLLMDACQWSMNGWAYGYNLDKSLGPQPPSMFSHNIYLQNRTFDTTVRNCLSDRPASQSYMMRGGVQMYDSIATEAGIGLMAMGGNYEGAGPIGNASLFLGCLVHLASIHYPVAQIGARGWARSQTGFINWVDNVIAHAIDPNDSAEYSRKTAIMPIGHGEYASLQGGTGPASKTEFDNTVTVNWGGRPDENIVIPAQDANEITAVNWYRAKSGNPSATLADFYAYTRSERPDKYVGEILDYFRQGLGVFYVAPRAAAATAIFTPDDRADGFRWDNRLNWSTGDAPGVNFRDTIDLYGNDVRFGNHKAAVPNLIMGGGRLDVVSGHLTADAITGAGHVAVRKCGQLHTEQNNTTALDVGVSGGRLNFKAAVQSGNMVVYGRSETLFGPDFTLPPGKTLTVESDLPRIGWDGTGTASLKLQGTLEMKSAIVLKSTSSQNGGDGWTFYHEGLAADWGSGSAQCVEVLRVGDSDRRMTLRNWTEVPSVGATPVFVPQRGTPSAADEVYATMPTIRRFRSGMYGVTDPTVTPSVTLSGPLVLGLHGMAAGTITLIDAATTGTFSGVTATGLDPALDATVTVTGSAVTLALAAGTGQVTLE